MHFVGIGIILSCLNNAQVIYRLFLTAEAILRAVAEMTEEYDTHFRTHTEDD